MRRTASGSLSKAAKKYLASKSRREIERLLREKAKKRRRGRVRRAFNPWEKWELALLGTAPDGELAQKLGRSRSAVHRQRLNLGRRPVLVYPRWTPEEIALLGTARDDVI